MNIDLLAENSRRWTPYNYAQNNPIFFIDPDGMQAVDPKKFNTEQLTFNNGYYDIKIGEFAGAADHSGFYPNQQFGKEGEHDPPGGGNDRPFGQPNYEQKPGKNFESIYSYPKGNVLDDITNQSFFEQAWSRLLDGRRWTDPSSGRVYMVGDDGKISGLAPIEIGSSAGLNLVGGRASLNMMTKVTSLVKSDIKLTKLAKETFEGNSILRTEANALIKQLSKGNLNPEIGTKNIGNNIFEARSRGGARVYFRNNNGGIEILGYSNKANQQTVIQAIFNTF